MLERLILKYVINDRKEFINADRDGQKDSTMKKRETEKDQKKRKKIKRNLYIYTNLGLLLWSITTV
jgi:hypothetical protein